MDLHEDSIDPLAAVDRVSPSAEPTSLKSSSPEDPSTFYDYDRNSPPTRRKRHAQVGTSPTCRSVLIMPPYSARTLDVRPKPFLSMRTSKGQSAEQATGADVTNTPLSAADGSQSQRNKTPSDGFTASRPRQLPQSRYQQQMKVLVATRPLSHLSGYCTRSPSSSLCIRFRGGRLATRPSRKGRRIRSTRLLLCCHSCH